MASGYQDQEKLRDALALARSFKSGDLKDKKHDKVDAGFMKGRRRPTEYYTEAVPPSVLYVKGPPPNTQRNYRDAGAFAPRPQVVGSNQSLLGGAGMAFLRREEHASNPIPAPSATSVVAETKLQTDNQKQKTFLASPPNTTPGKPNASVQGTTKPAANSAVGNIMDTFYAFAPPGIAPVDRKKDNTLVPSAATTSSPAPERVQVVNADQSSDNLMDTDTPEQRYVAPSSPFTITFTQPDASSAHNLPTLKSEKKFPGLGASRFADSGSTGSTPEPTTPASYLSNPAPNHQGGIEGQFIRQTPVGETQMGAAQAANRPASPCNQGTWQQIPMTANANMPLATHSQNMPPTKDRTENINSSNRPNQPNPSEAAVKKPPKKGLRQSMWA